jgi:DNA polymerase-2
MTLKGPIPLELDPKEPDYQHYIDRQLQPVADSILEVLGKSFDGILSRQLQLF